MTDGADVCRLLADEDATLAFGAGWAAALTAPLTVYLLGDLGAGKTTFARGLLRGLGYTGAVKSPTYAIVESYPFSGFTLHHFDLYRFATPEEWEDAGLDGLCGGGSICLIEWPQQGGRFAPAADLAVSLTRSEQGRACTVSALTDQGRKTLEAWLTTN